MPGVRRIDQLVPFQRAATPPPAPGEFHPPTAVHAFGDGHDTASRSLFLAPTGFGVGWIDQLVPFQLSASVSWWFAMLLLPTAVQTLGDTHDTAVQVRAGELRGRLDRPAGPVPAFRERFYVVRDDVASDGGADVRRHA